jgi:hypothetical protein
MKYFFEKMVYQSVKIWYAIANIKCDEEKSR